MRERSNSVADRAVARLSSGVCWYRLALKAIEWPQLDFEAGFIGLEATKNGEPRLVPILDGDMRDLLTAARKDRDENWPESMHVFNRGGQPIKDLRWAWSEAC